MTDTDWSTAKGIADERHFNEFILEVGGDLVAPLITRERVQNADYLFRSHGVIGEHKFIETDFAQRPGTLERVDALFEKYRSDDISDEKHPLYRELFGLLRVPLRRIIEKANKQIRSTKLELGLTDHRGAIFLVNDSFRSAPPGLLRDLVQSILRERERYRSIDVVVYLTNHFIEVSEVPFAGLLWGPVYKGHPSDKLAEFIDWLGSQWSRFSEERIGPFDGNWKGNYIDWDRAHVVTGPRRVERYDGDDDVGQQPG